MEETKMQKSDEAEQAALVAVEKWLSLLDFINYEETWNQSAEFFKTSVSLEKWKESIKPVHDLLGSVISRTLKSKEYTQELPGVPDGEYVVFQYDSVFENKKSGVETVTPMKDKNGEWRVSGYFVR